MTERLPPLADLLAKHGLASVEETPFPHTGFSGAALTRLAREDGASFVLKRMAIDRDWIMRATDDVDCREAAFAAAQVDLGPHAASPAIGAAIDGDEYAALMRDITPDLLPQGAITRAQLDRIIGAMAALHRVPAPVRSSISWCDVRSRLTLLTPAGAAIARSYGAPVARDIIEGWRLFDQHAPPSVRDLIHALFEDPSPLLRALTALPPAFLHGDLKFDNIGIDPGGQVWLIDWAMTLVAPPAVELGWFLAINSRRLPGTLDEVMRRYVDAAAVPMELRERHDGLTVLCGLLLRGWRKALDADGGRPAELAWWCERAEAARRFLA